jgi:hypothetical protein
VFDDLDESLRQMLVREGPLPASDIDIVFERPDRDRTARFSRPTVDLFMFAVDENRDQIDSGWEVTRNADRSATLRWPPLHVDLRYLVTVWAQQVEDEHSLIYHLYRTFRKVVEIPQELLVGAMESQPRPVALAIEPSDISAVTDLWGSIDNSIRPSLVIKATVAVDLNDARQVPQVRTATLRIGPRGGQPEARYRVSGHVRNPAGEPVGGASVRARGRVLPVFSDIDGAFHLTSLPGPEVEISLEATGFEPHSQTIALPGDYDFVLTPATSGQRPAEGDRPRPRRPRGGDA